MADKVFCKFSSSKHICYY